MTNIYQKIAVVVAGTIFSLAVMQVNREVKPATFENPIGQTSYQNWTTINHVDLEHGFSPVDNLGGNYTYKGYSDINYTSALTVRWQECRRCGKLNFQETRSKLMANG